MARSKEKKDKEFTDAQGNLHKHFADGRSEIYVGGFDKQAEYVEVTDGADEAVNRKRFLRYVALPVEETVQHNDPEVATREVEDTAMPGIDFDHTDIEDDDDS